MRGGRPCPPLSWLCGGGGGCGRRVKGGEALCPAGVEDASRGLAVLGAAARVRNTLAALVIVRVFDGSVHPGKCEDCRCFCTKVPVAGCGVP
jgi:hypothetical protein